MSSIMSNLSDLMSLRPGRSVTWAIAPPLTQWEAKSAERAINRERRRARIPGRLIVGWGSTFTVRCV